MKEKGKATVIVPFSFSFSFFLRRVFPPYFSFFFFLVLLYSFIKCKMGIVTIRLILVFIIFVYSLFCFFPCAYISSTLSVAIILLLLFRLINMYLFFVIQVAKMGILSVNPEQIRKREK